MSFLKKKEKRKTMAGMSLVKGERHITTDSTVQLEYQHGQSKTHVE